MVSINTANASIAHFLPLAEAQEKLRKSSDADFKTCLGQVVAIHEKICPTKGYFRGKTWEASHESLDLNKIYPNLADRSKLLSPLPKSEVIEISERIYQYIVEILIFRSCDYPFTNAAELSLMEGTLKSKVNYNGVKTYTLGPVNPNLVIPCVEFTAYNNQYTHKPFTSACAIGSAIAVKFLIERGCTIEDLDFEEFVTDGIVKRNPNYPGINDVIIQKLTYLFDKFALDFANPFLDKMREKIEGNAFDYRRKNFVAHDYEGPFYKFIEDKAKQQITRVLLTRIPVQPLTQIVFQYLHYKL